MGGIAVIVICGTIFAVAYRYYGTAIANLWQIDENRPTPAHSKYDGVDFVPSRNWLVLFGHHFASIAGAGPIIGPVIAVCLWGWLPALIWVVLGSIFQGAVHDFGSLMMSVREDGATIGDIARTAISRRAKIILSLFLWLALILVIAVFAYLGANTFVTQPKVVIPSVGILPVAIALGFALYKRKMKATWPTVIGLTVLGGLIALGYRYPIEMGENGQTIWLLVLMAYCFVASIAPVHYLLQPRDYLSSYLLIIGIVLALGGIFISRPELNTPAFISNSSALGPLWPMMFITVACGATSGFHAVIASGTTSKQLDNERDAKKVGFGAMLVEGFLAVIVIVMIVGGFSLPEFEQHVANKTSPIQMYGLGFGNVTAPLIGPWGEFIALTILNVFILTTLDSATRITRYLTEELFGIKNKYLSTGFIVAIGGWLALGRDNANTPLWQKIWPAFGASNQLVAALALLVIACWLLRKKKNTLYALIPAGFMLMTSVAALVLQLAGYLDKGEVLLSLISVVLIGAAAFLTWEVGVTFTRFRKIRPI